MWKPDGAGLRARIGILTPCLDPVPESEFQVLAPESVSIYAARVPLGMVGPDGSRALAFRSESFLKSILGLSRILTALTLIISLGACETVKEHLTDADKEVQGYFGTDMAASPEPEIGLRKEDEIKIADEAGALYQKALGHSERGETKAALSDQRTSERILIQQTTEWQWSEFLAVRSRPCSL